jgi:ABC-type glycerol-3-phosphate transport system permease component
MHNTRTLQSIKRLDNLLTNGILIAICAVMIYPVLYALMTSFKTQGDIVTFPPTFFPPEWTLDGYRQVFRSDMFRYYLPNTIINAVFSSLVTAPIACMAAYSFSRYKQKGNRWLMLGILGLMMIPGLTNLVALYRLGSVLKLLSTHTIMILVYTAGGLPFTIWIVKAFFDAIPIELEEAALIDGCSPVQSLRLVVMPLALPGLFAAFLMMLVDTWNEFLAAVILLSKNDSRTATVGLYDFQSQYEIAWHVLSAACIMIMLPVVIAFIFGRKTFFQAMLEGALKG